jgi:vesicle-associated membrane protein 7
MGEYLETDVAFSFLADLKKKFLATYDNQKIQSSYSYQLKNFSEEIHKLSDFYIKNPQSKLAMLKNNINQTSEIMHENVEKLFQRNEKLDITIQKSNNLLGTSDVFYKNIHRMKMKQKYKNIKILAFFILILLVIGLILYFIFK